MRRMMIVTLGAMGAVAFAAPGWAQGGSQGSTPSANGSGATAQGEQAQRQSATGTTPPAAPARAGVVKSKSNITNN